MDISVLSSLASSILGVGLALLIFFARSRSKSAIFFGIYLIGVSIWALEDAYAVVGPLLHLSLQQTMMLCHLAAVWVPAVGLQFICDFSRFRMPPVILAGMYALSAALMMLVFFSDQFILRDPNVHVMTNAFGPYYWFFVADLVGVAVASIGILIFRLFQSEGLIKHQIIYFLYAMAVLFAALIAYLLGVTIGLPIRLENFIHMIFALMVVYGMINIRLLDTVIILNRIVSFVVVMLGVLGSMVVVGMGLPGGWIRILGLAVVAMGWAWKGEYLRRQLQLYAESNWIPGYYNPERFFSGIMESLLATQSRESVLAVIQSAIVSVFPYALPRILYPGAEEIFPKKFEEFFATYSDPIRIGDLLTKLPVVPNHVPFSVNEVLIPIHSSTELVAVLCVTPSHDTLLFREKDLALFKTLGKHAFVVLDRLVPYEKIKEQYDKTMELAAITKTVIALKHEINSPLTAVLMTADYLQRSMGDDSPFKPHAESIVNDTRRIAKILKQLREISEPIYTEYLPGVSMLDRSSESK